MGTAHTTASTSSHSQTGMACFKLWLYWLRLDHLHQAAVTASYVVTFLFLEHLVLRWFHLFDYEKCCRLLFFFHLRGFFLAIVLKWDLAQLLYQKNIWFILVESCKHAPQEVAIIFQSLQYKDFDQLRGWFCIFLQTLFSLANVAPFLVGHTLLLLGLHRCIFFFHPKILSRWKKQNLTLSLGFLDAWQPHQLPSLLKSQTDGQCTCRKCWVYIQRVRSIWEVWSWLLACDVSSRTCVWTGQEFGWPTWCCSSCKFVPCQTLVLCEKWSSSIFCVCCRLDYDAKCTLMQRFLPLLDV